ncbi:MAG: MoxR family ATPase [Acidobacteria bacterium]|nr:MoxR family ATPase [Acidobacteriota bacterium]
MPVEGNTKALLRKVEGLRAEIHKVIVGQERVIEELLVTILAGGHGLLRGVPGLAKTKLVRTVAEATHLSFKRIQFTPDLLPSDVTGSEVLEDAAGAKSFRFLRGPVFVNLLLADEINRTAPKTQAALLEAMQEHQVTVGGVPHPLPAPFCVLATQNPIEQEGTYPLPEAQLDRFLLCIAVDYPAEDEEIAILKSTTGHEAGPVTPVLSVDEIVELQGLVRDVPVADDLVRDVARLVRASRTTEAGLPSVKRWIDWGAGPRAGQALLLSAKALALLSGRFAVSRADLKRLAAPVLRHRLVLSYAASAEGITADEVVRQLVDGSRL